MTGRKEGAVQKGWGYEVIWATNDLYCGKILAFHKAGNTTSMHFHKKKHKTWFINSGSFTVKWIDTEKGLAYDKELKEGETWIVEPLTPHQLTALEDGSSLSEVSTSDSIEDTYRIIPGDTQVGTQDTLE